MIGFSAYVSIGMMIAAGIILPLGLAIFWIARKNEKITTVLIGAAIWFIFSQILEAIPNTILFVPWIPVGKSVIENKFIVAIVSALFAGLFEESGRLFAFKKLLKDRNNKETAVSYGIGHGGFEAGYILIIAGITNLIYIFYIKSGQLTEMIERFKTTGTDTSTLEAIPGKLAELNVGDIFISIGERIIAIILHIALSILVFYAVKKAKIVFYFLAIGIHTGFDIIAGLYQLKLIPLWGCELILAVFAVVTLAIVYLKIYKGYKRDPIGIDITPDGLEYFVLEENQHHYEVSPKDKSIKYRNMQSPAENDITFPETFFDEKTDMLTDEKAEEIFDRLHELVFDNMVYPALPTLPAGPNPGPYLRMRYNGEDIYYPGKSVKTKNGTAVILNNEKTPQYNELAEMLEALCCFPEYIWETNEEI